MIMGCNDKYLNQAVANLSVLREYHRCILPVQIWHSGNELSEFAKLKLQEFGPITFHDILDYTDGSPNDFRGYQIKGYALAYTTFNDVILFDADLIFFKNPEILFDHPKYKETGAYLFRDQEWGTQGGDVAHLKLHKNDKSKREYNDPYYYKRKAFLSNYIKSPSIYSPKEWRHYWQTEVNPTLEHMISLEHGESGVVAVDKKRHCEGICYILELNQNHKTTYKIFLGDKETYWVGFEKAKEPYFVNLERPYAYVQSKNSLRPRNDIVQFLDGELFYQQKNIYPPTITTYFFRTDHQARIEDVKDKSQFTRRLTLEERRLYEQLLFLTRLANGE